MGTSDDEQARMPLLLVLLLMLVGALVALGARRDAAHLPHAMELTHEARK